MEEAGEGGTSTGTTAMRGEGRRTTFWRGSYCMSKHLTRVVGVYSQVEGERMNRHSSSSLTSPVHWVG